MFSVYPKTLQSDKFSQPFISLVSWSKTSWFISFIKEISAPFIKSTGFFMELGSRCASVRMQIVGISLSSFSILPLFAFILPQCLPCGCASQYELCGFFVVGFFLFSLFIWHMVPFSLCHTASVPNLLFSSLSSVTTIQLCT